ncbi:hypothetical protein ABDI49_30375 [Bacillus cereus]
MSYEKQLSKVEAISGSSASQMASLSGKARELGLQLVTQLQKRHRVWSIWP